MLRFLIVSPLLLALNLSVWAQEIEHRKWDASVFFELGGDAAIGVGLKGELISPGGYGIRVGVSYMSPTVVFPVQAVAVFGEGHSKFELAGGIAVAREGEGDPWEWDGTKMVLSGFAGYRHRSDGGTIFRLGVVYLGWTNNQIPWIAISIGG